MRPLAFHGCVTISQAFDEDQWQALYDDQTSRDDVASSERSILNRTSTT